MKSVIITLVVCLNYSILLGQSNLPGRYENGVANSLILRDDSTFFFMSHGSSLRTTWAQGIWYCINDTLHLEIISVYDTIKTFNSEGKLNKEYLSLSSDTIPDVIVFHQTGSVEDDVFELNLDIMAKHQIQKFASAVFIHKCNRLYEIDNINKKCKIRSASKYKKVRNARK